MRVSDLRLPTAHRVAYTFPAGGGPGEIYSTIIDAPAVGCWQFTLIWGPNTTHIELEYSAASAS